MDVTTVKVATKVGATLSGTSLITNMVIFSDPIFLILSILGASIAVVGTLLLSIREHSIKNKFLFTLDILKSAILGGIATPFLYLLLTHVEHIITITYFAGSTSYGISPSMWFLVSLLISWKLQDMYELLVSILRLLTVFALQKLKRWSNNGKHI